VGLQKIIEGLPGGGVSRAAKKDIAARVSSKINWGYFWGYINLLDIFLSYKTRLLTIRSIPAPGTIIYFIPRYIPYHSWLLDSLLYKNFQSSLKSSLFI